ncbi:hypothetical protein WG954_14290 [Lacibacter sp. H375]|uniref:hypothetical protein n=1 Tax=Lacibacter sp. H375 TaxID=3133424 RepID=UPI0030BD61C4
MSKLFTAKVLLAGIIVGTLDITAAMLQFFIKTGKDPFIVMKFIASGVFGNVAMKGGAAMVAWGFLFHYIIAICFTVFFFWLISRRPALLQNRLLTGIGYGIFTWAVMRFVVVPLSFATKQPSTLNGTLTAILILIVCIGIPLAYIAAAFRKQVA